MPDKQLSWSCPDCCKVISSYYPGQFKINKQRHIEKENTRKIRKMAEKNDALFEAQERNLISYVIEEGRKIGLSKIMSVLDAIDTLEGEKKRIEGAMRE